jgi:hypothetical protein
VYPEIIFKTMSLNKITVGVRIGGKEKKIQGMNS